MCVWVDSNLLPSCPFSSILLFFLSAYGTLCSLPSVRSPVCEMGMRTVPIVERIKQVNVCKAFRHSKHPINFGHYFHYLCYFM